jgi:hypothetical protein
MRVLPRTPPVRFRAKNVQFSGNMGALQNAASRSLHNCLVERTVVCVLGCAMVLPGGGSDCLGRWEW